MDEEMILKQIHNWNDDIYLSKVIEELRLYVSELDELFLQRCIKKNKRYTGSATDEIIHDLIKRGIINKNKEIIANNTVSISDVAGVNGGYSPKTGIIISLTGARLFYNSYLMFAKGNIKGISEKDYSLPLNEFSNLTEIEILYWCYKNNVLYEEFLKTTILHENTHKWTCFGAFTDDMIDTILSEGLVEAEARSFAAENGINYLPIFRNKEINVAKFFTKDLNKIVVDYWLRVNTLEHVIIDYLKSIKSPLDENYYGELNGFFTDAVQNRTDYYDKKTKNNEWQSLHDVINASSLFDENELIRNLVAFNNRFNTENKKSR